MSVALGEPRSTADLHDLAVALRGQKNVFGLEVAMHEPFGMGCREPTADVTDNADRFVERQRCFLGKSFPQRGPGRVVRHDVRAPVGREAVVPHADKVGALDSARQARLTHESRARVRAARELGCKDLDGHVLAGELVSTEKNGPPAATAKEANQTVPIGNQTSFHPAAWQN
jgi:hypothetical protein